MHRAAGLPDQSERLETQLRTICAVARTACHDVDNLLLAIDGSVHLLLAADGTNGETDRSHLDRIRAAGEQISTVTDRLRAAISLMLDEFEDDPG